MFNFDPHCDLALRVESRDPCFMLTLGIHCSVLLELEAVSLLLLVSRDGSHQSEKFVGSRLAAESEESVAEGKKKELKEKKREEKMDKAAMAKKQKKEI